MTPEERYDRLDASLHNIRDILAETTAGLARTEANVARNERQRRRAADEHLDDLITKLAAAQLVTEEKLQRFLEARRHHIGDSQTP